MLQPFEAGLDFGRTHPILHTGGLHGISKGALWLSPEHISDLPSFATRGRKVHGMLVGGVRFINISLEAGARLGAANSWLLEIAAAMAKLEDGAWMTWCGNFGKVTAPSAATSWSRVTRFEPSTTIPHWPVTLIAQTSHWGQLVLARRKPNVSPSSVKWDPCVSSPLRAGHWESATPRQLDDSWREWLLVAETDWCRFHDQRGQDTAAFVTRVSHNCARPQLENSHKDGRKSG